MNDLIKILAAAIAAIALSISLPGCGSSEPKSAEIHSADDGHDHAGDGDDHEGHDHAEGEHGEHDNHDQGDHDHGDAHELGSVTIDGAQFDVSISGVEPNAEAHIDIVQTGGPKPVAVRVWIGIESGAGSMKSKADGHDNHFHGHAESPASLQGAALWIEVESASGNRTARSLPLP